jgi:hypothetical protein
MSTEKTKMTVQDYEQVARELQAFASKVRPMLIRSASQVSRGSFVQRSARQEPSITNIKAKVLKTAGEVSGVGFAFPRHGVFVQKGVGRGYQMQAGKVVRVAKSAATGNTRQPVDWFNSIIDSQVPALADKIAGIHADLAVNATNFKIK